MSYPITLNTPMMQPVRKPGQLILLQEARRVGKSEWLRRERLAAKLMAAAERCTKDPAFREALRTKARACAYLPSSELRGPAPRPVRIEMGEDRPRPVNLMPWIKGLIGLSIAIALTGYR
jgi:hypothetical protein